MNFKYLLIAATALALFTGCEKEIPFSEEVKKPKLVLNSLFEGGKKWEAYISHSLPVTSGAELEPVDNAVLKLYKDNNFLGELNGEGDGKYSLDAPLPEPGAAFSIEVSAPGYTKINAEGSVPEETLELISIDTSRIVLLDVTYLNFEMKIKDNGNGRHYYGIKIITGFNDIHDEIYIYSRDPKVFIPGNEGFIGFFTNELFEGKTTTINIGADVIGYEGNDYQYNKVTIVFITYSKQAFDYQSSYEMYRVSLEDFFSEPVQVFNNIENGFGIFAGFKSEEHIYNLN